MERGRELLSPFIVTYSSLASMVYNLLPMDPIKDDTQSLLPLRRQEDKVLRGEVL